MYSAFFILLAWLVATVVIARVTTIPSSLLPAISFAPALSVLYIVYFNAIFLFSPETFSSLASLLIFGLIGFLIFQHDRTFQALRSFAIFLALFEPKDKIAESALVNNTWLINTFAIMRKLITVLAILALFISSYFAASPRNYDSNVYNIARIPSMIISSSPLLPETGSVRQAVYSMAHDLLFYPDIAHNSLRGLSMVSVIEFVVLLGAILQLAKLCVSELDIPETFRLLASEIAMLITLCMYIASDQHVMHGLSTKNDIVVWSLFAVSLLVTLACFKHQSILSRSELFAYSFLVLMYGVSAKPYGFIIILPLAFCYSISLFSQGTSFIFDERLWLDRSKVPNRSTSFSLDESWSFRWPFKVLVIISIVLFIILAVHFRFVSLHYHGPALAEVTTMWANNTSDLGVRIRIMILNFFRIIVSFFVYPYSTSLKVHAKSLDDYALGLGPIANLLTQGNLGVVKGYSFVISRYADEDHALTSPFFHIIFLTVILSNFVRLLSRPRQNLSMDYFLKLSLWRIPSTWVIVCASLSAILSVFFFILYQNWIFKYFGFGYVALMPVIAAFFTQLVLRYFISNPPLRLKTILALGVPIIATFLALILFLSHIPEYIRSSTSSAISLQLNSTGFKSSQDRLTYYYMYLNSIHISAAEGDKLLNKLKSNSTSSKLICFSEDTPSLVPLLAVSSSTSSRSSTRLLPMSSKLCGKRSSVSKSSQKNKGQDESRMQQQEEIIFLP